MRTMIAAAFLLAAPTMLMAQSAEDMMTQEQIDIARQIAYSASRCSPGSAATAHIVVDPHKTDLRDSCPKEAASWNLYYFNDAGAQEEIHACDILDAKKRDEVTPLLIASAKRIKEGDRDVRPLSPVNLYIESNAGVIMMLAAKLNSVHFGTLTNEDIKRELEFRSTETWLGISADELVEVGGAYCDIFTGSYQCTRH